MSAKKKKMAAALAAITKYLEDEDAAFQANLDQQADILDNIFSAWRHSGRQDVMAMRRLVQLRTFRRF